MLARANGLDVPRLGLAVSRKAAKRAVDRSRLKRVARETFRCRTDTPPADFVVIARPGASAEINAVLRTSLERHFGRLAARITA